MSLKKPKRGSPALDMTAMVDVAFLLLTFFILTTTKFREDTSLQVDSPTSISDTKAPETSLTTILISDSGAVFIGFSDISTREKALQFAQNPYDRDPQNIIPARVSKLSAEASHEFSIVSNFGVPFAQLPGWLALSPEDKKKYKQKGISAREIDTVAHTGNELRDWLYYARWADPEMKFTVKGDRDAPYSSFSDVINTLQEMKINHFGLITGLEEGPKGAAANKNKEAEKK